VAEGMLQKLQVELESWFDYNSIAKKTTRDQRSLAVVQTVSLGKNGLLPEAPNQGSLNRGDSFTYVHDSEPTVIPSFSGATRDPDSYIAYTKDPHTNSHS
jgi:hypothetical protein